MSDDYGHIKISRKAFQSVEEGGDPWWNEARAFSRWEAWQDMIQMAAWGPTEWRTEGGLVELSRGQTPPLSLTFLETRWKWSRKAVRTFLHACISDAKIVVKEGHSQRHSKGHSYVIVKYDHYQTGGHSKGHSKGHQKKQLKQVTTYMDDFAAFWAAYPKRAGGNPKARASKAWNARMREGADPIDIMEGLERYTAYLTAKKAVGSEYVMQAATFLSTDKRWAEEWTPASANGKPDGMDAEAMRLWLAKH